METWVFGRVFRKHEAKKHLLSRGSVSYPSHILFLQSSMRVEFRTHMSSFSPFSTSIIKIFQGSILVRNQNDGLQFVAQDGRAQVDTSTERSFIYDFKKSFREAQSILLRKVLFASCG